jgi:hypothetical protein
VNPADVEARLAEIVAQSDDNERAHVLEDDLWLNVLLAIARGSDEAQEMAKLAVTSRDIEFSRWYS